jgi:hypothetical protein
MNFWKNKNLISSGLPPNKYFTKIKFKRTPQNSIQIVFLTIDLETSNELVDYEFSEYIKLEYAIKLRNDLTKIIEDVNYYKNKERINKNYE